MGSFRSENDSAHAKRERQADMHPKNRYRYNMPDFQYLVDAYPELAKYTRKKDEDGQVSLNFKDWDACNELVKAQFLHDFGITWTVPKPHLVPPIANRLNYLCFIHDIMSLWSLKQNSDRLSYEYKVLDIGCGANLVYPLLGAAYFGWSFVGCDVNTDALHIAAHNRDLNEALAPLIMLRKIVRQPCQGNAEKEPKGIIGACLLDDTFDACMCNPPFFSDMKEMGQNPLTDFGGTSDEMVYPGGEECFVSEMIKDSERHKQSVSWFSTMVGKKKTLKLAKKILYSLDSNAIRTYELAQGSTHRWVIAWSFVAPKHIQDMPLPRYSKSWS